METLAHPFDAQFDSPEILQGWKDDVGEYVLDFMADGAGDPLGQTLGELLAAFDWEVEPTRADLERWYTEREAEIRQRLPGRMVERVIDETVDEFHMLRSKGRTVESIARSLKVPTAGMAYVVATHSTEQQRDGTRAALAARREEAAVKAYKARTRLYATLASKVDGEMQKRDFSDVKTEKLVEILLRLTEMAQQDELPHLQVQVGFRSV